ncbi:MAG: hypothetical protein ABSF82_03040 [Candidatus Bathyarchaeia archaeon]
MSIVTSVLSKIGFICAIYPKLASLETRLVRVRGRMPSSHIAGGRPWFSPTKAQRFQQLQMNQRTMNEGLYRLPVAR